MSRWVVDSLVSGSFSLGQARPQTAAYINQRSINYQDWASTQADSSPQGTMQGLATVPKKYPSPRQVTQSQKKPGAGWEVALEEVIIPLKMYSSDLTTRSPLIQTPALPLLVGWPHWSPDPTRPLSSSLPCRLKNPL